MLRVGVLGATGYSGHELLRLLLNHSQVSIRKIVSESCKDRAYSFVYRNFTSICDDVCMELNWDSLTDGIDILFSALPYGLLMKHLKSDMLDNIQLIDIGVDYRFLDKHEYEYYYGMEHESPELADRFTYGLSEWNEDQIRKARHIANPGCYATAIELALLPLIKENLISLNIIVDGKCGLSGSGRTLTLGTHFPEANESVKAYKLTTHPHSYEAARGIELFCGKQPSITFTPHIVPMQRGLLITAYAQLKGTANYERIRTAYDKYYEGRPFIQMLKRGIYVETKWVRCSNMCHINFEINERTGMLVVTAAIDNLIKGAAGQAVQNMNIMNGYPQDTGLDLIPACI